MPIVTFSEYAKHRGCSRAAVTIAVQDGRITPVDGPNGRKMIDVEKSDKEWAANTDHTQRNNGRGPPVSPEDMAHAQVKKDSTKHGVPLINESRGLREAFRARMAQLDYEERLKNLVTAAHAKKEAFECARLTRDNMLALPDRVSADCVGKNQFEIHRIWTAEIQKALKHLDEIIKGGPSVQAEDT